MLKDEPSLVICNQANDEQIVLESAQISMGETTFKKFFKVSMTHVDKQNQMHVSIGCHVLCNRTLSAIKHKSKDNNLLGWLKKE